jgi:hypothetical protein
VTQSWNRKVMNFIRHPTSSPIEFLNHLLVFADKTSNLELYLLGRALITAHQGDPADGILVDILQSSVVTSTSTVVTIQVDEMFHRRNRSAIALLGLIEFPVEDNVGPVE